MKPFGRNQRIAIVGSLIAFAATLAFAVVVAVLGSGVEALERWIGFVQLYVPATLAVILGASAAVKRVSPGSAPAESSEAES